VGDDRIHLNSEHETYLATLYGKAMDARAESPILGDTFADEAVRRIDFDFEKLKLPKGADISLPIRAKHLDGWTREFVASNPESIVLHLGCGLDSRVHRVNPPASVRWFDVDLPDVIDLRRQLRLYPERNGYEMLGTSVTDPHWLDAIPADKPVLVVAEGLVPYLSETEGLALLNRITERFCSGQIVFDAYSRLTVRLLTLAMTFARTHVRLEWGIDDPRTLERQVSRLELVDEVPFLTMPELVSRMVRTPFQKRLYRLEIRAAFLRKSIQHVRYRF